MALSSSIISRDAKADETEFQVEHPDRLPLLDHTAFPVLPLNMTSHLDLRYTPVLLSKVMGSLLNALHLRWQRKNHRF